MDNSSHTNTHPGREMDINDKDVLGPLARVNYPDTVCHGCMLRVIKSSRDHLILTELEEKLVYIYKRLHICILGGI